MEARAGWISLGLWRREGDLVGETTRERGEDARGCERRRVNRGVRLLQTMRATRDSIRETDDDDDVRRAPG